LARAEQELKTMNPFVVFQHPAVSRALPFFVFMLFVALGAEMMGQGAGQKGGIDLRWLYAVKTVVVASLLAWLWTHYAELRDLPVGWQAWVLTIAVGIGVFLLWIRLDLPWITMGSDRAYDPRRADGTLDLGLAGFRLFGSALVVPVIEELFWRSFFMRWIRERRFLSVRPAQVGFRALLLSAVPFALEHDLWLAGLLAGIAYGWLYMRTENLWFPIVAHAITNFALGVWVLRTGAWHFW
jgi:uncharacterized protein